MTPRRDNDGKREIRRAIDEVVAEIEEDDDIDVTYKEIEEVLLDVRDTLLVRGRVPDEFGNNDAPHLDGYVA